ncbi:MAG: hypothetical protein JST66_15640 [Bacteroidetes bacterium]|nr:hypothetical protein [Bacteroidota bacterium]
MLLGRSYHPCLLSVTVVCIFLSASTYAQSPFPEFESNVKDIEGEIALVTTELQGDTGAILIYSPRCYWPTKQTITVIRQRKGEWRAEKWTAQYRDRSKKELRSLSRKRLKIDQPVDHLLSELTAQGFWTMDQDSLNIHEKQLNDTTMSMTSISDGCSWAIAAIHRNEYRLLYAYEPELLQTFVFIPARERFISCLGAMRKTLLN